MKLVQAILTLVMGLLYYGVVAVPLTLFVIMLTLGVDFGAIMAIWTWPVFFAMDPMDAARGLAKGLAGKSEES